MLKLFSAAILAACLAGCCTNVEPISRVEAVYAPGLRVDAGMSDSAWQKAPEYRLRCYRNFQHLPEKTVAAIEAGKYEVQASAKLLYDDENLYIGCRIENDDIWTLDQQDQLRHYLTGDVFEVFLKPEESNAYLELYATPSGNNSALQTGADRSQTGSAGGSLRAGGQKAGQAGVVRTYRQAEFLNISMRCFRPGGRESPASTAAGNPHC